MHLLSNKQIAHNNSYCIEEDIVLLCKGNSTSYN